MSIQPESEAGLGVGHELQQEDETRTVGSRRIVKMTITGSDHWRAIFLVSELERQNE